MLGSETSSPAPVASRIVLEAAEQQNDQLGHENLGFLSRAAGFVPKRPTEGSFPASHAAWDEVVAAMPRLWRTVSVRSTLRDLPILSALPADLPDAFVWRAASALGIFAHSYVRSEKTPAGDLPAQIAQPWQQITDRLGRRQPHLAYNDLIIYNHRVRDPSLPFPYTVENMDLLVPTVDSDEERRFYLAQVEIMARATPVVEGVVRAQEAVVRGDREALERELLLILRTWRDIPELSLRKVDPNPASSSYVNQVPWANTVAPLAVPIREGAPGQGGAASAIFHLMDAFFGRRYNESELGREVAAIRGWFPPHHLQFLAAVGTLSVRDHLAARDDRALLSLFDTTFDAYAGKKGYLGQHRTKVYGFLELAFKVGRSVTIALVEGGFKDRQWKTVDTFLEETRAERYRERPLQPAYARLKSRRPASIASDVLRIVLDTSDTPVVYRPGDRCGILPTNRPEVVDATIRALRADGDEPIPLTAAWREAIAVRLDVEAGTSSLPLRRFLAYAKLRPLTRPVAKALLALTSSEGLRDVVEGYLENEWELCDALAVIGREGHSVRRFIEAGIGDHDALARIVPPEEFRMYSIASAPDGGVDGLSRELHLTVAQLRYRGRCGGRGAPSDSAASGDPGAAAAGPEMRGTASAFLGEVPEGESFPIQVVRPGRFALPRDLAAPVVMFAGGVGVAPFLGFLTERASSGASGENLLFLATRTRNHLYGEDDLTAAVEQGHLSLRVIFSAEDAQIRGLPGGALTRHEATRSHLADALAVDGDAQQQLWELLRSRADGGGEAYFYVCGRAGFAQDVITALTAAAARFVGHDDARVALRRLMAEGRYMQDVFTSWTPHAAPGVLGGGVYNASEVALHTDDTHGQWFVVNATVYDMTEFMHLHPGGPRIIAENVGLDATREYEAVSHHENSEIDAMLAMYKIGSVRRLDFGGRWGVAVVPRAGLAYVSLHDLFRYWVRFMHLLTEMGNALNNDWDYLRAALTPGDDPRALNALKVQLVSNTHQRFLANYYADALGDDLAGLWALSVGVCAPARYGRDLSTALAVARQSAAAREVRRFSESLKTLYQSVAGLDDTAASERHAPWHQLEVVCELVEEKDRAFLARMREIVRQGVRVFEQLESRTVTEGSGRLVAVLEQVPELVRAWNAAFVVGLDWIGWDRSAEARPAGSP